MEIKVEKFLEDDKLVFKITCTNGTEINQDINDWHIMQSIELATQSQPWSEAKDTWLKGHVQDELHCIKDEIFQSMVKHMTATVEFTLEPKFKHICGEIYNWQYDQAVPPLKKWLEKFDPQRTSYLFDNCSGDDEGEVEVGE